MGLTAVVAIIAVAAAHMIGQKQNEINGRLLTLQDYVAIYITPGNGIINIFNTGKSNVYIWGFDIPGNDQRFTKARLISAASIYPYWVPLPNLGKISKPTDFEFKLYLKDEYDNKWISENGGNAIPKTITKDGKKVSVYEFKVWSYKTYKSDWQL